MLSEVLYEPVFYPPRLDVIIPEVVIPEHRQGWFSRAKSVRRYVFPGFPDAIIDNLEGHILRTTKRALMLEDLSFSDREQIADIMQIHDVGEIGSIADMTTVNKKLDPEGALKLAHTEEKRAKKLLSSDDYKIWLQYESAKPLLEGKLDPRNTEVNPAAIMAKLVDVSDCETVFHYWFLDLQKSIGDEVYQLFPEASFNITFPRLRVYKQNIDRLGLPSDFLHTADELIREIEAMGRVAGQR